jgi:hypothetical protein
MQESGAITRLCDEMEVSAQFDAPAASSPRKKSSVPTASVSLAVKALCYNPEGREFETR